MKQSILNLILTAAVLLSVGGCRNDLATGGFKWPEADSVTDSLTQRLDRALFHRISPDSIAPLVGQMHRLAMRHPDDSGLRGRDLYFQAALSRAKGDFEHGDSLIELAKSSIDSAAHPYLYHRLLFLGDDIRDRTLDVYDNIRTRLTYFESVGDDFMTASQYTEMGNLLKNINYLSEAAKAYDKADSLYRITGFDDVSLGNSINHASVMSDMGDTVGALAILNRLRQDPDVTCRPEVLSIVLNNIYDLTSDSAIPYLLKEIEGESPRTKTLVFLSDEETRKGNFRQGADYAYSAFLKAYENNYGPDMALASFSAGRAYAALGMPDSAYVWTEQGVIISGEVERYAEQDKIVDAEIVDAIAGRRLEAELAYNRRLLRLVCIGAALIVLLMAAGWITASRIQRLRNQRRALEQHRSEVSRRLMATQIAMDESQQLISSVRKEIDDMAGAGDIAGTAARPIVSAIKSYEVKQGQRETFIESFTSMNPHFARRMSERNEAFTEPDIRLASYIVMGMDTKHIASTMGIRPESVKQGRWRLRTKLALQKGESLEEALRAFLD